MAFQIQKIDPLDRQARKVVGVDLPFSGKAVFNETYQTKDAIKANLINFLLTGNGERFLNPDFGVDLRALLFDNITQAQIESVKSIVSEKIRAFFPRIVINDLLIVGEPDFNVLYFTLRYSIRDTNIQEEEINIEITT